jgi:hypothetical protein
MIYEINFNYPIYLKFTITVYLKSTITVYQFRYWINIEIRDSFETNFPCHKDTKTLRFTLKIPIYQKTTIFSKTDLINFVILRLCSIKHFLLKRTEVSYCFYFQWFNMGL